MLTIQKLKFDMVEGFGLFKSVREKLNKKDESTSYFLELEKIGSGITLEITLEEFQTFTSQKALGKMEEGETALWYKAKLAPNNEATHIKTQEQKEFNFVTTSYGQGKLIRWSLAEDALRRQEQEATAISALKK